MRITNGLLIELIEWLRRFNNREDKIMAAIDDLNTIVAAVQAENAVVVTTLQTIAAQVTSLQATVASLQAQLANQTNNDPAIEADVATLTTGLASVQAAVAAAVPPAGS